jgi:hypothetical protein
LKLDPDSVGGGCRQVDAGKHYCSVALSTAIHIQSNQSTLSFNVVFSLYVPASHIPFLTVLVCCTKFAITSKPIRCAKEKSLPSIQMSAAVDMQPAEESQPQPFSAFPSLPVPPPYDEQSLIANLDISSHSVPLYNPLEYFLTFPSPDSNHVLSHPFPHQGDPSRTYSVTHDTILPVTIAQPYFPETPYHAVQGNRRWLMSDENIGAGKSVNYGHFLCPSQADAASGLVEDWTSFLNTPNTPERHEQLLPLLETPPQIPETVENDSHQSALMTTALCKPTKMNTKSEKVFGPRTPPILLEHHSKASESITIPHAC